MRWWLRHTFWAQIRDLRVLLQETRYSLLTFTGINLLGMVLFHYFYRYEGTGGQPDWGTSLFATFALNFFETVLPFPPQWFLRALYFLVPIIGLSAVAGSVLRIWTALIDKRERGEKWQVAMASTFNKHIIVCGLGKVGFRTIQELLKFKRDVVAIEINGDGAFVETTHTLGIPVIVGDARRTETLRKAGVDRADSIIPATDDELTNLDIALDAREISPKIKVVMRMFDPDLAQRIEKGFGIHTAFSASALAAPVFAAAAMRLDVKHSFYVGDTLLNVSEVMVAVGSKLIGLNIAQTEQKYDLSIVFYQNKQLCDVHPLAWQELAAGDTILVLASVPALEKINGDNNSL
ncbi:MAG: NAD(P)-binding protein [Caldilineaceae bacterium]